MTVAPLETAIENTPLGVIADGSMLSDGGHLLSGDPMLPAGRVGEGVGRGGGSEVRERESRLSGGGERERDPLERSPRLTDGYSSDPQSSSDVQSHTPSSTSLQTSSFSSASSSVSGGSRAFPPHSDLKSRLRPELPERRSMRLMANDEKVDSYFSAFFDDDEGDDEYFPVEEWKQEIRVGPSYQVEVANVSSQEPYSQQRDTPGDSLLWRPRSPEDRVVSYLKTVSTVVKPDSGINSWETEQAMKLLQECDHNVQRAVDVVQEQGLPTGTRQWSEEECSEFEEGLRVSGKDFFQLRKMVPSRSVKELVEFYYIWKKSKRYEDFIIQHGKIGKKKVTLQPGQVFDLMDNYLNMQDSTAPDLHYATTTVYAEHKKETV
ncbi:Mesoderm induction early response protein 1 [Geodia barretti]|uniref:Mesoderm induction early response protein 1 n=1 Tax=Geodia barretti TaxID=519541 RepID=A0AA35SS52_GEOBA|nr:Mesoderm induction early response protein 1 [Geodia barretti]